MILFVLVFFYWKYFFFFVLSNEQSHSRTTIYTYTHTCTHDIVGALINMFNSSLNSRVFFCLHLSLLQWNWKLQMNDRDGMNWVKIAICAPLPMQTIDFYANHSHTRNTNIFKILVWFGWTFFFFLSLKLKCLCFNSQMTNHRFATTYTRHFFFSHSARRLCLSYDIFLTLFICRNYFFHCIMEICYRKKIEEF